jgi:poly-beta-1,6-N-acetyl-D-glucosamine synthase
VLVLYPVALLALPRRRWLQAPLEPRVSVIVPAYSETEPLSQKLGSLAALDYPAERLQIVVVSDGNPGLAALARRVAANAVVIELPERGGKPGALNAGLAAADGEIVVITDSHSSLEPDALHLAVRHFADPSVHGVSGRWRERGSAYDGYEHMLRALETRSGSTAAVFGAFMALRAGSIGVLPEDVVNDDLWLLCEVVRAGGRMIYEPGVVMTEEPLADDRALERRTRIGAGRAMLGGELRGLPIGFAVRVGSHKYGRLGLPFLLVGAQLSALGLARRRRYRVLAGLQVALHGFGVAAAAGLIPAERGPARAARQFTLGNIGTACGVWRALRHRQDVRWTAVR